MILSDCMHFNCMIVSHFRVFEPHFQVGPFPNIHIFSQIIQPFIQIASNTSVWSHWDLWQHLFCLKQVVLSLIFHPFMLDCIFLFLKAISVRTFLQMLAVVSLFAFLIDCYEYTITICITSSIKYYQISIYTLQFYSKFKSICDIYKNTCLWSEYNLIHHLVWERWIRMCMSGLIIEV